MFLFRFKLGLFYSSQKCSRWLMWSNKGKKWQESNPVKESSDTAACWRHITLSPVSPCASRGSNAGFVSTKTWPNGVRRNLCVTQSSLRYISHGFSAGPEGCLRPPAHGHDLSLHPSTTLTQPTPWCYQNICKKSTPAHQCNPAITSNWERSSNLDLNYFFTGIHYMALTDSTNNSPC